MHVNQSYLDDDLPLGKILKMYDVMIFIRSTFRSYYF